MYEPSQFMRRSIVFKHLKPLINSLINAKLTGLHHEVSYGFILMCILFQNKELDRVLHILDIKVEDLVPVRITSHFEFDLCLLYFLEGLILGFFLRRSIFYFNIVIHLDEWVHLFHHVEVFVKLSFFDLNGKLSFDHFKI